MIDDDTWTNALSEANGGAPIVEVEFEDIADGGEWLAMEFNMAEAGGGDHGMLYWDAMDEDDFFPLDQGEGVHPLDASIFMIPDSHLRGPETPPQLLSADISGSAPISPTELPARPARRRFSPWGRMKNTMPKSWTVSSTTMRYSLPLHPPRRRGSRFR